MTSRLSSSGTISSTRCFGDFPSAVTPVEQFFRRAARRERRSARQHVSTMARREGDHAGRYLLDARDGGQLVALEDVHAFLGHVEVQRELRARAGAGTRARQYGIWGVYGVRDGRTDLFALFLVLREAREHVFHVVQRRRALPARRPRPRDEEDEEDEAEAADEDDEDAETKRNETRRNESRRDSNE